MTQLAQHLAMYADYHRNPRNVATHMAGIPIIVLAIDALLSRPIWMVGGLPLTPAILLSILSSIYYLRLDRGFGTLMALLLAAACWVGLQVAALPTGQWLAISIGAFVFGWLLQFIGHGFEGRKPAFLDDLRGLLIGPLFIVAELIFALGLRPDLKSSVHEQAGRA